MNAAQIRVLLLESVHPDAADLLEAGGFAVRSLPRCLSEAELRPLLDGVHLLGVRSKTAVTECLLAAAPDLLALGAFCIGTDQIDLAAASRAGVCVFNAPFSNTRSVVELALAEIIALTRQLTEKNSSMHKGAWDKAADGSHEVRGQRLGIIGYGNIGTQLSVLAEGLGMQVSFYDLTDKLALGNASRCGSLDELLAESDVVTLHVDGREGNRELIGPDELARMKPGSLLLNLSRGFVVDHAALRKAIMSGHLGGAAVDVFPTEPKGRGDLFESDLRDLPNVILTPHVGGSTEEAQTDIGGFVAGKLLNFLTEGSTTLSVNLPVVDLPRESAGDRITLVHHNTPGVLGGFNSVLAEHRLNIEGQALATRGGYGYLITDIAGRCTDDARLCLDALSQTIRLRVLAPGAPR